MYISTWDTIYQYDLKSQDVLFSKTIVAIWDGFTGSFPCTFNAMQRGPDCRIYINSPNSQKYLHVIMHPDVKGPDCEVRQHEIPLYYYHQISMPYFPNYRLGTGEPVCDSTLFLPTSIPVVSLPEEGLRIWPNPASGDCRVMVAPEVLRQAVTLKVVDLWGRTVLTRDLSTNYEEVIPIDVSPLKPVVYFVRVIGRNGARWVERLVVD
ncbi:MAG: T9SS type A sorting domain-containing protein [Saprospiraceae bacterium]|nr:T9SS type A sorting domain-containing protein [Saprospiraceae bacterium]